MVVSSNTSVPRDAADIRHVVTGSGRSADTKSLRRWASTMALALAMAPVLPAQQPLANLPSGQLLGRPPALQKVGIDQNLNHQMPLDAVFTDETGKSVRLGDYFGRRPVVLAFVYYTCPMLCNLELDGLMSSIKKVSLKPGADYEIVAISIDPHDTPSIAAGKKAAYAKILGDSSGLHFLTGADDQIHLAADAAGFHYAWDPRQKQFAHASGVMIATPEGLLSRYFYGIHYDQRDLRLGLVEASSNKIGSPVDEVLLFCYHYDPTTGKYGLVIVNTLRVVGSAFFLAMVAGIFVIARRNQHAKNTPADGGPGQERYV